MWLAAALHPLRLQPPDCHVVAVRVTAEDATDGFKPTSGRIDELHFRPTPEVRPPVLMRTLLQLQPGLHGHLGAIVGPQALLGRTPHMCREELQADVELCPLLNPSPSPPIIP